MKAEMKLVRMVHVFIDWFLIGAVLSDDKNAVVIKVRINKDVTLPCLVYNRDNNVDVKWYKNPHVLISVNEHVKHSYKLRMSVRKPYHGEWSLHIKSVNDRDAGNYTCRAGEEVKSQVELIVETPPNIHMTTDMTFDEGDTGTLWCNATGTPTPTIQWYWKPSHQTDEIGQDKGAKGNRLVLHNITRYYDNEYICLAQNSVDVARSVIQISVKFGPEVFVLHNTIIATKGQEVTVLCAVEAFPMDGDLEWAFQNDSGRILSGWKYNLQYDKEMVDNYHTLFLSMTIRETFLDDSDYGKYVCRAINFSRGYSENVVVIQRK